MESSNNSRLLSRKKLLNELVFPHLDDQSLIRFGAIYEGASKLVDPFIRSRGIVLKKSLPIQHVPVDIVLTDEDYNKVEIPLNGSLSSSGLCSKRATNIERNGKETSVIHHVDIDPESLKRVVRYFEVASNTLQSLEWAIQNLEDAPRDRKLGVIQAAETLKIEWVLLWASRHMAGFIKDKTVGQMRNIFGFCDDDDNPGLVFDEKYEHEDDDYNHDVIKGMKHFFELMIPLLDDNTYLRFASTYTACAKLVNEVQARTCFLSGQEVDKWNITIICLDGETKATNAVIALSGLIKNLQIDNPYEYILKITLKSVKIGVFTRVQQFCNMHASTNEDKLQTCDAHTLLDIAQAARTLKIWFLLDLISKNLVRMINKKEVPQMRVALQVKNGFKELHEVWDWEQKWKQKFDWAFPSDPSPVKRRVTVDDLLACLPPRERESLMKSMSFGQDEECDFQDEGHKDDGEAAAGDRLFAAKDEGQKDDEEAAREDKTSSIESDKSVSEDSHEDDSKDGSEEGEESDGFEVEVVDHGRWCIERLLGRGR